MIEGCRARYLPPQKFAEGFRFAAVTELATARDEALLANLNVRENLSAFKGAYLQLQTDRDVAAALKIVGADHQLGPTKGYSLKKFAKLENAVLVNHVTLCRESGRLRITAILDEELVAAFTYHERKEPSVIPASLAQSLGIKPTEGSVSTLRAPDGRTFTCSPSNPESSSRQIRGEGRGGLVLPAEGEDLTRPSFKPLPTRSSALPSLESAAAGSSPAETLAKGLDVGDLDPQRRRRPRSLAAFRRAIRDQHVDLCQARNVTHGMPSDLGVVGQNRSLVGVGDHHPFALHDVFVVVKHAFGCDTAGREHRPGRVILGEPRLGAGADQQPGIWKQEAAGEKYLPKAASERRASMVLASLSELVMIRSGTGGRQEASCNVVVPPSMNTTSPPRSSPTAA